MAAGLFEQAQTADWEFVMASGEFGIDSFLAGLQLEPTGESSYRCSNVKVGGNVIFGGQLLAQTIMAGSRQEPGKRVKTVHTIFARGGSLDADVEIAVDVIHSGRAFASSTVTISQSGRLCTRALVLLSADEPDLIRHSDRMPEVGAPEQAPKGGHQLGAWEVRVVDGVDINDSSAVGPADLDVWTRFVDAPEDPTINQALLAFATDGFLIGTAMRPHEGIGQSQAHDTLSTGVVSHTLTFHEAVSVSDWVLLSHHSPYAGHGRSYGRADAFTRQGTLVASLVQDNMIRAMPPQVARS